jgi:hypothetical protein
VQGREGIVAMVPKLMRRNCVMHSVELRGRPNDVVSDWRIQWAGDERNGRANRKPNMNHADQNEVTGRSIGLNYTSPIFVYAPQENDTTAPAAR